MAGRRGQGPGVSFFAFQDIITAVVGIFILITLILVLELVERVEAASAKPTADLQPVLESIATLQEEVDRMTEEVDRRTAARSEAAQINEFNRQEMTDQMAGRAMAAELQLDRLLLEVDLAERRLSASEQDSRELSERSASFEDDRRLIDQLKEKIGKLREQTERLQSDDSLVYRDTAESGRFIGLVVLRSNELELRDAATKANRKFQGPQRLSAFRQWLETTDLSQRHLLFVIKPGGAGDFLALESDLQDSGAVYGFDIAGANDNYRLGFESP